MANRYDLTTYNRPKAIFYSSLPYWDPQLVPHGDAIWAALDTGPITIVFTPDSPMDIAKHQTGERRPRNSEGSVGHVVLTKTGPDSFRAEEYLYAYFEPEQQKKGFLGGLFGGGGGGILGGLFASALCGPAAPACAAGVVAAGAATGTIAGSGIESGITGADFNVGNVFQSAAINAATAGIASGVGSALGPVSSFAALPAGVEGPLQLITTPGLLSASAAGGVGTLVSSAARVGISALTQSNVSQGAAIGGMPALRPAPRPVAVSSGPINTTGAVYVPGRNSVDVPVSAGYSAGYSADPIEVGQILPISASAEQTGGGVRAEWIVGAAMAAIVSLMLSRKGGTYA